MKIKIIFSIALLSITISGYAQQTINWDKYSWLIGSWKGEGSGQPGKSGGTFSFSSGLDKKILMRYGHSEIITGDDRPPIIHDDLMIIYPDLSGNPVRAIYFDNEGHVINYSIACKDSSIVFLSEKTPNVPVFRLTYILLDNETIDTKFELSKDGETFILYVQGKSKKDK